jgi:hypothetical protein
MRKPVHLAILVFSVVVTGVSLGVTLTRFLGLLAYSPKGTAQAAATPAGPGVPAAAPEEWTNLFAPGDGMKLASRLPAVDAKTGSRATRTGFVLVGTIVSSTQSTSRAILWANGMKEPKAFREKEEVEPGAFIASVERDKVWITRGNEREKLEILPVGSRGRPTAATARPAAPAVASTDPPPAPSPGMPPRPGAVDAPRPSPDSTQAVAAPRPSPDSTQAVAPPDASSRAAEDEGSSPRERRRQSRGTRQ